MECMFYISWDQPSLAYPFNEEDCCNKYYKIKSCQTGFAKERLSGLKNPNSAIWQAEMGPAISILIK